MEKIITLLAVVLGWLLNEASSLLRLRREDLRTAGPVVADLLEIRHQSVALETVMEELRTQFQIPPQAQMQLQQFMRALMPEPPRFLEKYEEAVSDLGSR